MNILGLSGLAHDSAAALLSDDGILAAMEESKLVRRRTAAGIPREAIRFCLERAGTGWNGVECVAVASRPVRTWVRQAWMRAKLTPFAPVPSGYYQTKALGELGRELNNGRLLEMLGESPHLKVLHLEHHLCHAASAFYASDADRALVLTLDEQGDGRSGSIALGEGNRLRVLESIPFPHSPAWIFSQITDLIGFTPHADEHKTQWLGLEGDPAFEALFLEMLRRAPGKLPRLATALFQCGSCRTHRFLSEILSSRWSGPRHRQSRGDGLAASADSGGVAQAACRERPAGVWHARRGTGGAVPEADRREILVPGRRIVSEPGGGLARGKKHGLRSRFRSARGGK